MNRIVFIAFLSLFWLGKTSGQAADPSPKARELLEKGQLALLENKYERARRHFQRALDIAPGYPAAQRYLIAADELLGNTLEAAANAEELLSRHPNFSRVLYFQTGMLQFRNGNYDRALELFTLFKELQDQPIANFGILGETEQETEEKFLTQVDEQMLSCRIAREASKFSRVSSVENLGPGVNTAADEYFPCVSNDQTWMFYTSRRNRFSDEDLYISYYAGEWMEGLPLPASFLSSHNEGMSTLVRSGRRMYFTACGRTAVKGTCDIWEASVEESSPKKPLPLAGDLNSEAWDSQASVSCDGTIMFFASNREGGLGGTDIWMSRMLADGDWSAPENLGPPINTPGDEEAPFITNDGKSLFFSSTGHDGLGEQDIFLSRIDSAGRWSAPFNLGPPINSSFRELGFFLTADGKTGYFASDRSGGYGGMDIYRFQLPELLAGRPIAFVEGQILDSISWNPVPATLFLDSGEKIRAGEDGRFFLCLPVDDFLSFAIIEPGYAVYDRDIRIPVWENRKSYPLSIFLQPTQFIETTEAGVLTFSGPPGRQVSHAVYFAFDKAELQEESTRLLEEFLAKLPESAQIAEVEIIGYSDQVGSEKYNLILSENRAKSVALFLKDKGMQVDRLYIAGSGAMMSSIPESEKRRVDIVFHLK
jgi:hypothetical protein